MQKYIHALLVFLVFKCICGQDATVSLLINSRQAMSYGTSHVVRNYPMHSEFDSLCNGAQDAHESDAKLSALHRISYLLENVDKTSVDTARIVQRMNIMHDREQYSIGDFIANKRARIAAHACAALWSGYAGYAGYFLSQSTSLSLFALGPTLIMAAAGCLTLNLCSIGCDCANLNRSCSCWYDTPNSNCCCLKSPVQACIQKIITQADELPETRIIPIPLPASLEEPASLECAVCVQKDIRELVVNTPYTCSGNHPDYLCLKCALKMNICPLCRAELKK